MRAMAKEHGVDMGVFESNVEPLAKLQPGEACKALRSFARRLPESRGEDLAAVLADVLGG